MGLGNFDHESCEIWEFFHQVCLLFPVQQNPKELMMHLEVNEGFLPVEVKQSLEIYRRSSFFLRTHNS